MFDYNLATLDPHIDWLYSVYYNSFIAVFVVATIFVFLSSVNSNILIKRHNNNLFFTFIFAIIIAVYFGIRSIFGAYPGDTYMYDWTWQHLVQEKSIENVELEGEWVFLYLQLFIYRFVGARFEYFTLFVALIYVMFHFLTCYKVMRNSIWIAFLFCVVSFSFFSYGVNGIRNGMACSTVMLAIPMLLGNKYEKICAVSLMLIAYGLHHSTILPSFCALFALLLRDTKIAVAFWFISIIVSLLIGNSIGDYFASLGFDERTHYFEDASISIRSKSFSSTGFRWDFLLYSSMPILMTWYVTIKRTFKDKVFNLIAITYILSNSFWIMVIRATYSNRFAYLSWFLYPIIIAYPLIRFKMWDKQNRYSALILFLYAGFTYFMVLIRN